MREKNIKYITKIRQKTKIKTKKIKNLQNNKGFSYTYSLEKRWKCNEDDETGF